jgi:recombination protein RecA
MLNLAHTLFPSEIARHVGFASELPRSFAVPGWYLSYLAGKLVELRSKEASAGLTAGLGLVRSAQEAHETAVWMTSKDSIFFFPDAIASGVDLDALVVLRLPGTVAFLHAADKLVRSGAFGLIVVDLVSLFLPFSVSLSQQARLLGFAQKHQAAVVFLTREAQPLSVAGSLISVRGQVQRLPSGRDLHKVNIRVLKDKQSGPGWHHAEFCRGPAGLC